MKPPAKKQPPRDKPLASEEYDRKLAAEALAHRRAGEPIPRHKLAALRRVEKREEDRQFWAAVTKGCTKKRYLEMAGRQARTINEQADRYDLPIRGPVINLVELVARLHQFLADNAGALLSEDALLGGPKTASLERLRRAQAEKVELQNALTKGELRPADDVHKCYQVIAGVFRQASAALKQQCGDEAHDILAEAVDTADDMLGGYMRNDRRRGTPTDAA